MSTSLSDYLAYLIPEGQPAGQELSHIKLYDPLSPTVEVPNDNGAGAILFDLHKVPRKLDGWDVVYNNDIQHVGQWLFSLYRNVDQIAAVMGGSFNQITQAQEPPVVVPDGDNEVENISGDAPFNVQIGGLQGQIGDRLLSGTTHNGKSTVPSFPAEWSVVEPGSGWNIEKKRTLSWAVDQFDQIIGNTRAGMTGYTNGSDTSMDSASPNGIWNTVNFFDNNGTADDLDDDRLLHSIRDNIERLNVAIGSRTVSNPVGWSLGHTFAVVDPKVIGGYVSARQNTTDMINDLNVAIGSRDIINNSGSYLLKDKSTSNNSISLTNLFNAINDGVGDRVIPDNGNYFVLNSMTGATITASLVALNSQIGDRNYTVPASGFSGMYAKISAGTPVSGETITASINKLVGSVGSRQYRTQATCEDNDTVTASLNRISDMIGDRVLTNTTGNFLFAGDDFRKYTVEGVPDAHVNLTQILNSINIGFGSRDMTGSQSHVLRIQSGSSITNMLDVINTSGLGHREPQSASRYYLSNDVSSTDSIIELADHLNNVMNVSNGSNQTQVNNNREFIVNNTIWGAAGVGKGFRFPLDIGSGSGDAAGMENYIKSGEATRLRIYNYNDADDDIVLQAGAFDFLDPAGTTSYLSIASGGAASFNSSVNVGGALDVTGTVVNRSSVTNMGAVINESIVTNKAAVINESTVRNDGAVTNKSTVVNEGAVTNQSTVVMENGFSMTGGTASYSSGTTINKTSVTENVTGGSVTNNGVSITNENVAVSNDANTSITNTGTTISNTNVTETSTGGTIENTNVSVTNEGGSIQNNNSSITNTAVTQVVSGGTISQTNVTETITGGTITKTNVTQNTTGGTITNTNTTVTNEGGTTNNNNVTNNITGGTTTYIKDPNGLAPIFQGTPPVYQTPIIIGTGGGIRGPGGETIVNETGNISLKDVGTTETDTTKFLSPTGTLLKDKDGDDIPDTYGVQWASLPADAIPNVEDLSTAGTVGADKVLQSDGSGGVSWEDVSANVDDMTTSELDTAKIIQPDGSGGLTWSTPSANVDDMDTSENDTAKVLQPDGSGGLVWNTPAASVTVAENLSATSTASDEVLQPDGLGGVKFSGAISKQIADIATSMPVGTIWSSLPVTLELSNSLHSLAPGDSRIVGVGKGPAGAGEIAGGTFRAAYSTDGISWTVVDPVLTEDTQAFVGNAGTLTSNAVQSRVIRTKYTTAGGTTVEKFASYAFQSDFRIVSTDGGSTWTSEVLPANIKPANTGHISTVLAIDDTTVILAGQNGVSVSTDGGQTFSLPVLTDRPQHLVNNTNGIVTGFRWGGVFAGSSPTGYIYRASTGAWTTFTAPAASFYAPLTTSGVVSAAYAGKAYQSATNGTRLVMLTYGSHYVTDIGITYSDDMGVTWKKDFTGLPKITAVGGGGVNGAGFGHLQYIKGAWILYGAYSNKNMWISQDGVNWKESISGSNLGLSTTSYYNGRLISAGDQKILYSLGNDSSVATTGGTVGAHNHDSSYLSKTGNDTSTGVITAAGFNTSSDFRLKKDIQNTSLGLNELSQMAPISYKYKDRGDDRKKYGFLAQQLQGILPEAVSEDSSGFLSIDANQIIPILVNAVKELSCRVAELEGNK